MTAHDRPPGPEGGPIAETIARVSRSAVVVCDKCRLHGANNDVTVCRAPGNCHDLADHSRAAALLADECSRLQERVRVLEAALRPFADRAADYDRPVDDPGYPIEPDYRPKEQRTRRLLIGDLRAARAALEGSE